jgi:hypothetical protein
MAELFPFKFFDSIRGRWIQARYKATPEEITTRYERWEIIGPGWTPSGVVAGTAGHLAAPRGFAVSSGLPPVPASLAPSRAPGPE